MVSQHALQAVSQHALQVSGGVSRLTPPWTATAAGTEFSELLFNLESYAYNSEQGKKLKLVSNDGSL